MLTPKKQQFAREYLKDLNAKQAAIRAGYSEHTAHVQGSRLLRDVDVAKLIQAGRDKAVDKAEISAQRVVDAFAEIAFSLGEGTKDRLTALRNLGEYLSLFKQELKHSGEIQLPVRVVHEYQMLAAGSSLTINAITAQVIDVQPVSRLTESTLSDAKE